MEENNENVVEETTQPVEQTAEAENTTQPVEENTEQESHISFNEDGDIKIDLAKFNELNKEQNAVPEQETNEVPVRDESEASEEVQQENVEATNEEPTGEQEQAVQDEEPSTGEDAEEEQVDYLDLPENVEKLVEFMNETGGDINDYVKLNTNTEEWDDSEVLHDYYKKTKPHLNGEEINFLLEDTFSYDEEADDPKDIRRKQLALKEQVAEARSYLDGQKSKYYEEIKAGSNLTKDQQEAIDFYNRYNQEEEQREEMIRTQQSTFVNKTDKVFDKNFKGFEFNVGDKKMTYQVPSVNDVRNTQIDINNFVGKFLNEGVMSDAAGYHKGLFAAMNPDAIAKHFYEQGKSDAIKQSVSDSKNINTSRESHKVYEGQGGIKFKVLGDDSNDMKLRIKKRN